jgi:O-antigen ligase
LVIWLPILWYAVETSRSISRWLAVFGYQVALTSDPLEGTPIDRTVLSIMMVVAIGILVSRKTRWGTLLNNNRWLCALFLFMLFSVIWSDYPLVSVKRWMRAMVDVLMALIVLTDRDPLEAECTVIRRVMLVNILLSVIMIKYFRPFAIGWDQFGEEMWTGTTIHKNVLGQVVMTGSLYFIFELLRKRWNTTSALYVAYLLMAAWILRGGGTHRSNTAILGVVIGTLVLVCLHLLRSRAARIRRYLAAAAFVAACLVVVFQAYEAITDESVLSVAVTASGRDVTLTGRTDLWADLWRIAWERPIAGVGYGAFWIGNTHNLWDIHLWGPTQGHNGYLDVFLEIGAIGFVLLVGAIVAAGRRLLTALASNFEQAALHLTFLIVIVIHNVSESSYLRGSVDLWFLFLLATITVPRVLAPVAVHSGALTTSARIGITPYRPVTSVGLKRRRENRE